MTAMNSSLKKIPRAMRKPSDFPPLMLVLISVKKAGPKLSMLMRKPCPMPFNMGIIQNNSIAK